MNKVLFALLMAGTPIVPLGSSTSGNERITLRRLCLGFERAIMSSSNKLKKIEEGRPVGTRHVFEAVRMLGQQVPEFEDDSLPEMHPGVLMKSRQDGGGWQRE